MADTLLWFYELLQTLALWSSRLFDVLQSSFAELIARIPADSTVGSIISNVLTFIVDGIGIGDLSIITFLFGSGFALFIGLMVVRWIRGILF